MWNGNQVVVETRPSPPVAGMNEFLVIITAPGRLPVYDVVVDLRMNGSGKWGQGIQDGNTGVFRKALRVGAEGEQYLEVRLGRDGQQWFLTFPLGVAG